MTPYSIGDVCRYTGTDPIWSGEHIIKECEMEGPDSFEYATTQGAWIDHEDLELVEKSSCKSRRLLWESMEHEMI